MKRHTVPDNQEWILDTSYVARNRLADVAITNRQAAIRGLPVVGDEDAEAIIRVILALRGTDKKKQIDALQEGALFLKPVDLSMQGTSH